MNEVKVQVTVSAIHLMFFMVLIPNPYMIFITEAIKQNKTVSIIQTTK